MPLEVSGDRTKSYVGEGISEDLAARLGQVPGLKVLGRTSIRQLRGRVAERILFNLHAPVVLRGSVTPGINPLRIDVELVEVATGRSLWKHAYARPAGEVLSMESDIAWQVAAILRLGRAEGGVEARSSARHVDPVAYDLYLQGRDAAERRDRTKAIGLYEQALDRDSSLVEARACLSQALYLEDFYAGSTRDPRVAARAVSEAEAAIAADPEMAQAHLAYALASPNHSKALGSLSRALAIDPSYGEAWHHAGDMIVAFDPQRALAYYRASLALDPALDSNRRDMASALEALNRVPEAQRTLAVARDLRPDRPWWKQMEVRIALNQQQYDQAATALAAERATESTPIVWLMGRVIPLRLAGRSEDAMKAAMRLTERYPWYCEGRAVLAGLAWENKAGQQARTLADAIFAEASRPNASASTWPCAALAAAATEDPAATGAWLRRIAGDEQALRTWSREAVFSLSMSLQRHWYPWNKVDQISPVPEAIAEVGKSLARLKDEAGQHLPPAATAEAVGRAR